MWGIISKITLINEAFNKFLPSTILQPEGKPFFTFKYTMGFLTVEIKTFFPAKNSIT
jgi:hypothetical protein